MRGSLFFKSRKLSGRKKQKVSKKKEKAERISLGGKLEMLAGESRKKGTAHGMGKNLEGKIPAKASFHRNRVLRQRGKICGSPENAAGDLQRRVSGMKAENFCRRKN